MKKGFAGPPEGISLFPERGGVTATLTGYDLTTNVAPGQIFKPAPLFVDNCKSCKNMNTKRNLDSGNYGYGAGYDYGYTPGKLDNNSGGGNSFFQGLNLADLLKIGSTIYSNEQQIKLAEQQGQITAAQAAQAKAQLAIAKENTQQSGDKSSIIKAYGVPIAIGGTIIILGIAAYFFFKKKKIS
jgi:hypothetical protein